MSNTVCVGKDYVPFKWEGRVLYGYFYRENAWLPLKETGNKNKYGDKIFKKY